jgi:hypothetical protein
MKKNRIPTRRSFIWTAGAAVSAPLAAAAAPPSPVGTGDDPATRLAMLEEAQAIRALNRLFARHIEAGASAEAAALFVDPSAASIGARVVGIAPDGFEEHDAIEVFPDRAAATARVHCTVETAEPIEPSCPLVEMAREQGGGVIRNTARVVFEKSYVKRGGVWKIARSAYRPV